MRKKKKITSRFDDDCLFTLLDVFKSGFKFRYIKMRSMDHRGGGGGSVSGSAV